MIEVLNTITIATPVHNRGWILPYFLKHLYNINYDKKKINLYFLLNNSSDNSENLLNEFKSNHNTEYNSIQIEKYKTSYKFEDSRTSSIRSKYTYNHLSKIRNKILSTNSSDYLLSVDSDVLVPPNILVNLLVHKKDIVSALLYNGYEMYPDEYWKYPNILNIESGKIKHFYNWHIKNAQILSKSKLYQVDITGAVVLMSKEVTKKTKYSWHIQGEDVAWSLDCKNNGFNLYCDVGVYCQHIMNEKMLMQKGEGI